MNSSYDRMFVQQRVRQNTFSAGFGAACLLVFGFGMYTLASDPQSIQGLFGAGDILSRWTLRVGGILMLIAASWSFFGGLNALVFDAVASTLTGACMALSGALMLFGGGAPLNPMLYGLFGSLFIVEGLRNGRDWAAIRQGTGAGSAENTYDPLFQQRYDATRAAPMPTSSLGSRLRERSAAPDEPALPTALRPVQPATPPQARVIAPGVEPVSPAAPPTPKIPDDPAPPPPPSPPLGKGSLAAFADDDGPRGQ